MDRRGVEPRLPRPPEEGRASMESRNKNRFQEALKENFNVVGLSTVAALSMATLNPLPLLVGLVVEAAYLLFVPDSKWYEQRLSRRHDSEVEQRRRKLKEQVFQKLRPEMQDRFSRLEETRAQLDSQGPVDQTWFREVLRKLDYLLEKFLLFASKEVEFRTYLQSVLAEIRNERQRGKSPRLADFDIEVVDRRHGNRGKVKVNDAAAAARDLPNDPSDRWVQTTVEEIQAHYQQEMDSLQTQAQREQDENTRAVIEKRHDVLRRRSEGVGKIGRILVNLNHQLKLLEDTFGLINDEIRARSPEQVLSDIEDVVYQTDSMTRLLEEMAPYESMIARLGG